MMNEKKHETLQFHNEIQTTAENFSLQKLTKSIASSFSHLYFVQIHELISYNALGKANEKLESFTSTFQEKFPIEHWQNLIFFVTMRFELLIQ